MFAIFMSLSGMHPLAAQEERIHTISYYPCSMQHQRANASVHLFAPLACMFDFVPSIVVHYMMHHLGCMCCCICIILRYVA